MLLNFLLWHGHVGGRLLNFFIEYLEARLKSTVSTPMSTWNFTWLEQSHAKFLIDLTWYFFWCSISNCILYIIFFTWKFTQITNNLMFKLIYIFSQIVLSPKIELKHWLTLHDASKLMYIYLPVFIILFKHISIMLKRCIQEHYRPYINAWLVPGLIAGGLVVTGKK